MTLTIHRHSSPGATCTDSADYPALILLTLTGFVADGDGAVAVQSRGGRPGPDGAGVVLPAACWWRMVRGVAGWRVLAAESRSQRNPRPDGDGLLPLPKGS
jgi:hypothetical protein